MIGEAAGGRVLSRCRVRRSRRARFQASTGALAATTTTLQVLVLRSLGVLGAITFLWCREIAIDDLDFSYRGSMIGWSRGAR